MTILPILAIGGPTAVGKSAAALALADALDAARVSSIFVSADSRQVFRGFDIGTDKISAEIRAVRPHACIDIAEASDAFTARVAFYSVPAFESAGGRALAHLIERHLRDVVPRLTVQGMRLPILRETKMPAVVLTLGPSEFMAPRGQRIADAIFLALLAWAP